MTSLEGRDESANQRQNHADMVPTDRRLNQPPALSRGIERARRLEVDFTRPLHSQPADFSRRCLVPFGDFDSLLFA